MIRIEFTTLSGETAVIHIVPTRESQSWAPSSGWWPGRSGSVARPEPQLPGYNDDSDSSTNRRLVPKKSVIERAPVRTNTRCPRWHQMSLRTGVLTSLITGRATTIVIVPWQLGFLLPLSEGLSISSGETGSWVPGRATDPPRPYSLRPARQLIDWGMHSLQRCWLRRLPFGETWLGGLFWGTRSWSYGPWTRAHIGLKRCRDIWCSAR